MSSVPLVFVVGTGRCGTHTTHKFFESVPNTLSSHEGTGLIPGGPHGLGGKVVRMGSMWELNAYLYRAAAKDVFDASFNPQGGLRVFMENCFGDRRVAIEWCRKNGVAFCDSNWISYNFINFIHDRYPEAKFIHLVRDGYACVQSWSRRNTIYPSEVPPPQNMSWIVSRPIPFPSDADYAVWHSWERLKRISWYWNNVNDVIMKRLEEVPAENKMVLRIEELNEETAQDVLDFCGLPHRYEVAAVAPADVTSGPSVWNDEAVQGFNSVAAPMMKRLGYPLR